MTHNRSELEGSRRRIEDLESGLQRQQAESELRDREIGALRTQLESSKAQLAHTILQVPSFPILAAGYSYS